MAQAVGADTAAKRRACGADEQRTPRRDALVQAALAAIEEDGPDAMTGQIAERAGLARPHVYRHFESKDELDRAVARAARADLTGQIRATLGVSGTPDELIRSPLRAMLAWVQERPNVYRFLLRRSVGTSGRAVPQGALAADVTALVHRYLASVAAERGSAVDLDAAMSGIIGLIDARVLWWLDHPDVDADALAAELTDTVWVLMDHYQRLSGIVIDRHQRIQFER